MHAEVLVLRVVHVLGSVLWVGTALFVSLFLVPAMGMAGAAGAPVMGALVKRRLFVVVPTVAVITMLAGFRLLWLNSTGFSASYFASMSGRSYAVGSVLALAGFTLFMMVNRPAIGRIVQLAQQIAQTPEAERGPLVAHLNAARRRSARAGTIIAVLLALAAVTMAIGRYV